MTIVAPLDASLAILSEATENALVGRSGDEGLWAVPDDRRMRSTAYYVIAAVTGVIWAVARVIERVGRRPQPPVRPLRQPRSPKPVRPRRRH